MNIVLAGVGGQGSVLATAIVGAAARRSGLDVVTSEVHGMSQRGGSVVTAVRFGAGTLAPVIDEGDADILVAFERLEGVRHLSLLKAGGLALVNDHRISPTLSSMLLVDYPAEIDSAAQAAGVELLTVPATTLATELGDARLAGTVMLGFLANCLDIPLAAWHEAIAETVPAHTAALNIAAFSTGEEWGVGPPSLAF